MITESKLDITIRWLIRQDLADVMAIDRDCNPDSYWTRQEFVDILGLRNCIGFVAEVEDINGDPEVIGFVAYQLAEHDICILNFAVDPTIQRQGVGTAMVDKLKGKLGKYRTGIVTRVRERNLGGQLFFRQMGFRCNHIAEGHYSGEDAYLMAYSIRGRKAK